MPQRQRSDDIGQKLLIGLALTLALVVVLSLVIWLEPVRMKRSAQAFRQEAVARGEELFAAHCTSCHGEDGRGTSGSPATPLNNRAFLEQASDEDIREAIYYGRPGTDMVAWGLARGGPLGDHPVDNLTAFIRHWEATAETLPTPTPDVDAEELYGARCVRCHGLTGEGRPGLPLALRPRAYPDGAAEAVMRQQIQGGKPAIGMPACAPDLEEAEVDALIALVKGWRETLPEGGVETPTPPRVPDPFRGADLFATGCASCHGELGRGGTIVERAINGPDTLNRYAPKAVKALVRQGIPGTAMPAFRDTLSDEDLDDLAALFQRWQWALLFAR